MLVALGGVAERSNAAVLKTAEVARLPWVRIPPPPHLVGISARFVVTAFVADRVPCSHAYSHRPGQTGRMGTWALHAFVMNVPLRALLLPSHSLRRARHARGELAAGISHCSASDGCGVVKIAGQRAGSRTAPCDL